MRGAILMLCAMTAFTVNDACMKALSDELPLFQALFLRSCGVCILLVLLVWSQGAYLHRVSRQDAGLMALRSAAEIGAAFFFISSLFNMPIANVTAIIQALPLTVTLASAVFLREPVGWRRMAAIVVGFIGVILIVRPGGDGFSLYSLYAISAVACVTLRDICARRMSTEIPSLLVAFAAALAVLCFSGLGASAVTWQSLSPLAGAQLFGATLFVIGGYICSVAAMRVGEIGFVAPFRYSSLLVALILGFFFFGEWPDAVTTLGATIVVSAGLYTLWRETRFKRAGTC